MNKKVSKEIYTFTKEIFPIPFDAIQASGGSLSQNPGY